MTFYASTATGSINLQPTLAASSSGLGDPPPGRHHPISCTSTLYLHEDSTFECEHTQVPGGDPRTQACIDHSMAMLLFELLRQRENGDAG